MDDQLLRLLLDAGNFLEELCHEIDQINSTLRRQQIKFSTISFEEIAEEESKFRVREINFFYQIFNELLLVFEVVSV